MIFFDVMNPVPMREVIISWDRKKVRKSEVMLIRRVTCVHHTSVASSRFTIAVESNLL
jgi:hypothetical protein